MLLEITNNFRLADAIQTLGIKTEGSFASSSTTPHQDLVCEGIIRAQLTKALPRLRNCRTLLNVTYPMDHEQRHGRRMTLGRSLLSARFLEYEDGDCCGAKEEDVFISEGGFYYSSYVACDILHAVTCSNNTIARIDLGRDIELGPIADYLRLPPKIGEPTSLAANLSFNLTYYRHTDDEGIIARSMSIMDKNIPAGPCLDVMLQRFPLLTTLSFEHDFSESPECFPSTFPPCLQNFSFCESLAEQVFTSLLLSGLHSIQGLEELELRQLRFNSLKAIRYFLEDLLTLSALQKLRVSGWNFGIDDYKSVCFQPCAWRNQGKAFETSDTSRDLPIWIAMARECRCYSMSPEPGDLPEFDDSDEEMTG